MSKRIWLAGAVLSVLPLAIQDGVATAAKSKPKPVKSVARRAACVTNLTITIAAGDTSVTPPVQHGQEYGTADCGDVLGQGIQHDRFTVADSGDTVATYTMYFPTGSIHGKFALTPQEGSESNFSQAAYLGTLTVTGGTGAFSGAKGTGTMKCDSSDGIHTACTDKLTMSNL